MFMKKVLVSALFAAGSIGAVATPTSSVAQVDVQLNFGPPAVYYEAVPARRGDRDGDGIANRRDATPDGRGPRRDRDNDGVPNRYDRTPDGATRRDRDGDGVPNRYDAAPANSNYR